MSFLDLLGLPAAYAASIPAAEAAGRAATQHPKGGFLGMLWLPLLIIVVFYFLLIRPQSKRAKEHKNLMSNITVGDEVVTTGGIVAKIAKMKDTFVVLEITKNVEITVQKSSIAQVLPKGTVDSIN